MKTDSSFNWHIEWQLKEMRWRGQLPKNTKGVGSSVRREKVEKIVYKNGEEALAAKSSLFGYEIFGINSY